MGLPEVAGLSVVLGLAVVGAGVAVVVVRAAEVVGALVGVVVVSGPEVAVEAGDVVAGTDLAGGGA